MQHFLHRLCCCPQRCCFPRGLGIIGLIESCVQCSAGFKTHAQMIHICFSSNVLPSWLAWLNRNLVFCQLSCCVQGSCVHRFGRIIIVVGFLFLALAKIEVGDSCFFLCYFETYSEIVFYLLYLAWVWNKIPIDWNFIIVFWFLGDYLNTKSQNWNLEMQ